MERDLLVTKEFEEILFITVFVSFISPNTPLIRTSELQAAKERLQDPLSESVLYETTATPQSQRFASLTSTPRAALPRIEDRARDFHSALQALKRSRPQLSNKSSLPPRMSRTHLKPDPRPYRSELSAKHVSETETELFKKVDEYTMAARFRSDRTGKQFHSEPRRRQGSYRPKQPRQNDSSRRLLIRPNLENSQLSFGGFKTQLTPLKPRHRETIMLEFKSEITPRRTNISHPTSSRRNMSIQQTKQSSRALGHRSSVKRSFDSAGLLW